MKRSMAFVVVIAVVFGWMGISRADVFGSRQTDIFKVQGPVKLGETVNAATEPATASFIDQETVIGVVGKVITSLGARGGYGYDFIRHEGVTTTGATLYTVDNFCLDLNLINADGAGIGAAYNVGAALPVQNTPILKYLSYLYSDVTGGARYCDGSWKVAVVADLQIKFSF